jgi:glyoxylase-like metal-dependent hydrolase (beta-lactamase superfamily II)
MQKISSDVYVFDSNAHTALLTANRLILVDTGTKPDGSLIIPDIKKIGYKVSDIETIIITHTHPDHVGGLAKFHELSQAKVASHEIEAKFITKQEIYQGPPGAESQRHPSTPVDYRLTDGQEFEGLLVIHTPGHTLGHISLLDKENEILYAGDSMRNDGGEIHPMPDMYNIDPKQHIESMTKLANYNFEMVIFGHGDPLSRRGAELLREYVASI